jgi:HlyD family secretion protein
MLKLLLPTRKPARGDSAEIPAADGSLNSRKQRVETPKGRPVRHRWRRSKKWWGVLAAILVLALFVVRRNRSREVAHAEVETAVVERGDVRATVSATGILQPFTTVDVKSKAGGTILKMAVEEGTRVRRGQLIALIDQQDTTAAYNQALADVNAAQAAVRQAQQNVRLQNESIGPQIQQSAESLSAARARLKQARENLTLESTTVGPAVQQSAESLSAARSRLAQAEEALALQRRTSETAVQEAQGGVVATQARLEQAQEQARTQPALSAASIAQAQASVEASQANLRSAQENLRLLQSATQPQQTAAVQAQVEQARSDLETAQTNLSRQEALLARGFVAQNTVDTARNQVVTARSALQTAQARLDTIREEQVAEVRDQQARIEQATGSLNQARAALTTARTNSVQDRLRTRDVAAARAALRQAQAGLASAIANRRQVALKQADVTSAQAAVRQAEAALRSTQANTRQVNVRAADVESAQAAVRQAEAALRGSQANTIQNRVRAEDVAQARARLVRAEVTARNARTNLQQTTVVAPRDGVVLKKYVDEGTIIQSGQSGFSGGTSIVQLANVSRVYVDVQVDEADIALIEPGQEVSITLDAYPNSPKAGKVRKVFPQAETLQNVTYIHVQVEIDPMDVDERLRPNMNATCDFLVEEKTNAIAVPSEAVKDEEDATTVTVIKDPKKPLWEATNQEKRKVEVGVRGDAMTEITSGLKLGETVATQITEPVTASGSDGGAGRQGGVSPLGGGMTRPPRR